MTLSLIFKARQATSDRYAKTLLEDGDGSKEGQNTALVAVIQIFVFK